MLESVDEQTGPPKRERSVTDTMKVWSTIVDVDHINATLPADKKKRVLRVLLERRRRMCVALTVSTVSFISTFGGDSRRSFHALLPVPLLDVELLACRCAEKRCRSRIADGDATSSATPPPPPLFGVASGGSAEASIDGSPVVVAPASLAASSLHAALDEDAACGGVGEPLPVAAEAAAATRSAASCAIGTSCATIE